jgi:hypothetical protein
VSGDSRRLTDPGGTLRPLIAGLHAATRELAGLPFALVGGLAVLVHVQGHRVTEDIDHAVQVTRNDVSTRLGVIARAVAGVDLGFTTPAGAHLDVLLVRDTPIRRGVGRAREAKSEALRWAVTTATTWLGPDPGSTSARLAEPPVGAGPRPTHRVGLSQALSSLQPR